MAKVDKILAEFDVLQAAADQFKEAIMEFQRTYTPNTVGLVEWQENIDNVLYDIYEDIEVEMENR